MKYILKKHINLRVKVVSEHVVKTWRELADNSTLY
jgi:hypothetical protein